MSREDNYVSIEEIKSMYEKGHSLEWIAAELGMSKARVRRRLLVEEAHLYRSNTDKVYQTLSDSCSRWTSSRIIEILRCAGYSGSVGLDNAIRDLHNGEHIAGIGKVYKSVLMNLKFERY